MRESWDLFRSNKCRLTLRRSLSAPSAEEVRELAASDPDSIATHAVRHANAASACQMRISSSFGDLRHGALLVRARQISLA
jgi:hypothetical protein